MSENNDPFNKFEFPEPVPHKIHRLEGVKRFYGSINRFIKKIAPLSAILSLLLISVGIYLGYPVYKNFYYTDPSQDGYVSPRSPGDVVNRVQESVVKVICDDNPNDDGFWYGSGWAINQPTSSKEYKTSIITNHHVIEDCVDNHGVVKIEDLAGSVYKAVIDIYDSENDLAKLSTTKKLPTLKLSPNIPYPGYWVMTFGSPDEFVGSISVGTVMNTTELEVLITANISHGNSGGPLVDNEGLVIGTSSWGSKGEQYNGAMSLNAMCAKIIKCKFENGTIFWDYS